MRARMAVAAAMAAAMGFGRAAEASDPVGVYALVEKVVLEPSADAPERAQVWGAFAVARLGRGDRYEAARWGYFDFALPEEQAEKARKEWKDLAAKAGSGEVVTFGNRYRQEGVRVRAPDEARGEATPYPLGLGLSRVRNAAYGPIAQLMALPKPLAPAPGAEAAVDRNEASGYQVALVARNCAGPQEGTRYLFEVERASGEVIASPPVEPGEGETRWIAPIVLEPGEAVTWRVRVLRDGLAVAPVASARFRATAG